MVAAPHDQQSKTTGDDSPADRFAQAPREAGKALAESVAEAGQMSIEDSCSIDWRAPLEAVSDDGRRFDVTGWRPSEAVGSAVLIENADFSDCPFGFNLDGSPFHPRYGWRLRNIVPEKPDLGNHRTEGVYAIGHEARTHWLRYGSTTGDAFVTLHRQSAGQTAEVLDGVRSYRLNREVKAGELVTTDDISRPSRIDQGASEALGEPVYKLDPTPEEQRANLDRIAGTSRPTAAEVKAILDKLAEEGRFFRRNGHIQDGDTNIYGDGVADWLERISAMLDRLAVEVLMLDQVIDDQQRAIAAAGTNPPAGVELAQLLANLDTFAEREGNPARKRLLQQAKASLLDHMRQVENLGRYRRMVDRIAMWSDAEVNRVDPLQIRYIARVVDDGGDPEYPPFGHLPAPALNMGEIRELRTLIRQATPAVKLVNQLATMSDTESDFLDGAALREAAHCALAGDVFTFPHVYGDEDRKRASDAIFERYYAGGGPIQNTPIKPVELVDLVAQALGMRKASQ